MEKKAQYFAPSALEEALKLLQKHQLTVIAGGTDLLVQNYEKLPALGSILDMSRIDALKGIEVGKEVSIYTLTTHAQLEAHPWIKEKLPFLAAAAGEVGSPQVRNRGTAGGNIVNASPAADLAPPLISLDARVFLQKGNEERIINLDDFFLGPGQSVLEKGELLVKVVFKPPPARAAGCYIKIGQRKAQAIAITSVAVLVEMAADGKEIADIRICLGSVGPVPIRARKTEALLQGASRANLPLKEACRILEAEIAPMDDIRGTAWYRQQVSKTIFRRALMQALAHGEVR